MFPNQSIGGIASYLANLPLFRTTKTVRELILEKLDNIIVENYAPSLETLIGIAEAIITLHYIVITGQSEIINSVERNKSNFIKHIEIQNRPVSTPSGCLIG